MYTCFSKSQNPHNPRTLVFVRPIIIVVRTPLIMMRGRPSTKWCWALTDSDQLGFRVSPKNHRIYVNKYFFVSNLLRDWFRLRAVWNVSNCPIYLRLIFAKTKKSSTSNVTWYVFQTGILQATQAVNIKFKLWKNQIHQTWFFKLEFCKNQGHIDSGNN